MCVCIRSLLQIMTIYYIKRTIYFKRFIIRRIYMCGYKNSLLRYEGIGGVNTDTD